MEIELHKNVLIRRKFEYFFSLLVLFYTIIIIISMWRYQELLVYVTVIFPLFIIFVYLVFEKTEYVLLAYIATLPFFQHLSSKGLLLGDFVITPHMAIQFVITIIVFSKYLFFFGERKNNISILDKLIIVFGLFSIFSLLGSYYFPINHTKKWLLFYTGIIEPITFYFVVLFFLKKKENFSTMIVLALSLTSFFSFLVALFEFKLVGFNIISIFFARTRIGFGYYNTNLFGIHSSLLLPIIFYSLTLSKLQKYRIVILTSLFLLLLLSVLSFNRGTFLVMGMQLFFLYFLKENRKIIHFLLVIFLFGALYYNQLLMLYFYRFFNSFLSTQSHSVLDQSMIYRLSAWQVGLKILLTYPFGTGGGSFQYFYEFWGIDSLFYLGTPHQLFLSIAVDYGTQTAIIFILLLVVSFFYSSTIMKKKKTEGTRIFAYIKISIVSYLVYGFITDGELSHLTGFTYPNNGYTLFLMSLLSLVSYYYAKYVKSSDGKNKLNCK